MGGDVTSAQARRKVTLPPGYSQLHWMRLTQSGKDLSGLRGAPPRRKISIAEVNEHNTEDDCWSILDGKVYNLTPYMQFHPGGIPYLMMAAGGDCTDLFREYHAWVNGHGMLEKCLVGELDLESVTSATGGDNATASKFALDKNEWRAFRLLAKQTVSAQTIKLTFELPPRKYLGLEVAGQHLKIRATIDDCVIERAYTPSSKFTQAGSFDLLIKVYADGRMTRYLDALEVESATVEMQGPHGTITYVPPGRVLRSSKQQPSQRVTHCVLLAGGSGITPMLQVIRAAFEALEDATRITLVYSSTSLAHVIALDQLEPLANIFPQRFALHHVLSRASVEDANALGSFQIGRVDKEMLETLVPDFVAAAACDSDKQAQSTTAVFVCGPPQYEDAMTQYLTELRVSPSHVYVF